VLKDKRFWIGALVGVVVVMYVWPMVGRMTTKRQDG
jgi:hypothetical protein